MPTGMFLPSPTVLTWKVATSVASYTTWRRRDGRDERGEHDGYQQQKPSDVASQLTMAAQLFANVLDRISANDWERTAGYNYPRQSERSSRWVAVHTAHEVSHHTLDLRRQLISDTPRNRLRVDDGGLSHTQ